MSRKAKSPWKLRCHDLGEDRPPGKRYVGEVLHNGSVQMLLYGESPEDLEVEAFSFRSRLEAQVVSPELQMGEELADIDLDFNGWDSW